MLLDFDTDLSINQALFLITSLSPQAKESVELELYRASAESDEASEQFVLDDAFVNLIKDLETIGIDLSFDYDNITQDLPRLFKFIHLTSYLLPNSLHPIIKAQPLIRECLEHIAGGSLGSDEMFIQTYLSELGGLDGQPALIPDLTEALDQLYPFFSQTAIFTDYVKNMLTLVNEEKLALESDHDQHQLFREYTREMIGRLSDAVNLFEDHPAYNKMCVIQNWVIKDLLSPTNFIAYNYLFTTSPADLPEDLVESFQRKWYHYRVGHMWCQDYYPVRQIEAPEAAVMMMYAFVYATCRDLVSYTDQVSKLQQVHPHAIGEVLEKLYDKEQ